MLRITYFVCIIIIYLIQIPVIIRSWDISPIARHRNSSVLHVSLFYIRAFLCITGNGIPTLIETSWPENLIPTTPKIFPNDLSHSKSSNACNGILNAISTDVDEFHSHLWVLDNGSEHCSPKIIVYNLIKKNEEIHRYIFEEFPGGSFQSIEIHPGTKTSINGTIAMLTLKQDNGFLGIYSMNEKKWWRVHFIYENTIINPLQISFKKNKHLFIADEWGQLWTTQDDILNQIQFNNNENDLDGNFVNVTFIENLLGPSESLCIDPKDNLYYYLPRDGAIVRWNSKKDLNAENHDILHLTSARISQIIFGARGTVWAVRIQANSNIDHCVRILFHYGAKSTFS